MTEQYLRYLYFDTDSPVTYSGINSLWRQIKTDKKKIKRKEVVEWLKKQDVYTLHKPGRKNYSLYRKVMVNGVDKQWQTDLVDMQEFHTSNKGFRYILTVIDCFSKYAWVIPLKTKTGKECMEAFKVIFKERKPHKIQFDEGKEFYNRDVEGLLEKEEIEFFSTKSDKKASIVERFNRTIKTRMYKYFTEEDTKIWIDIVDDLVGDYNTSYHRSIMMSPVEGSKKENEEIVYNNLYGGDIVDTFGVPKFKVGQSVRISKYKGAFKKGYLPNFTKEIFYVTEIIYGNPIVYKLIDWNGELIEGTFYQEELSEYNKTDSDYEVEEIINKKKIKGKMYALVKWKGYDDSFNEWIPMENIN